MAEVVGTLVYEIAGDSSKLISESRRAQAENKRTGDSFEALGAKLNTIVRALGIYAAALALVKATKLADEVRLLGTRVEVAAGSVQKGAEAMAELQRISARTQTEIAANAQVFNRLNQSLLQMGGTQQDTLRITELLGKAIKVSGASGAEASSAMTQFGQALGSGKLQGDELRSLLENAPYLMRQLADGIGVPVGALKQMGEEGKLTADVVVNALSKAAAKIDADFKKLPATFEGSMAAASDSAARATEALDNLLGVGAAVTGVTRGMGDVFEALATQMRDTTTEADKLGRNDSIKSWADFTTVVLAKVLDLGQMIGRTFGIIGETIYRTNNVLANLIRGRAGEAGEELQALRQVWADFNSLTAGGKILQQREALASGTDGSDRLDRLARAGTRASTLRPPAGAGDKKKAGKFDADAYMAGLLEGTLDGNAKIDAAEREAMRNAAELFKEKKLSHQQYSDAIALIQQDAAKQRIALAEKEAEDLRDAFRRADEANVAAEKKAAEDRARGRSFAQGLIGAADPVAAILNETEEKSRILQEAAERDLENAELYEAARVALVQETQRKLSEIRQRDLDLQVAAQQQTLAAYSQAASDIYQVLAQAGRERTALAKAAFLASKALAVAEIIINTEVAASKALAQFGVYGLPVSTAIRVSGYASAGIVAGQALADTFGGGRQYGGPVSAGSMYRVNETGRPEMFTAANGAQYMLPTSSGNVTSADQVAGRGPTIIINNAPPGTTARWDPQREQAIIDVAVDRAEARIAEGVVERRGQVWRALGTTNVRGQQ